ncbi:NADH dehydrogenase [ubiquinone] 1 beta subcomplex subunit 11, mitochondrial [Coccinella septempunctata]|uniref:NADH dehydrogenase [ubiquinone] 1 beta subcomplex subunit 11, mitochondrial n=1 Tax=Coccinella septempunctata TaxID=41139 RepID=UPI001D064969|nr:NADH dehydrogenase [ubiquinone] 1 beta subcomplex subunit 11, mitochondrial [Coccinella septempunctata]
MGSQVLLSRVLVRRFININNKRLVSVSSKKNDTVAVDECKTVPKPNKNWISFGYYDKDKSKDRFYGHMSFFTCVTLALTLGTFYFAYVPDHTYKDWAQREAYIELARREKNGLPLIDPNLISVDKIQLPSDEELGETEIII